MQKPSLLRQCREDANCSQFPTEPLFTSRTPELTKKIPLSGPRQESGHTGDPHTCKAVQPFRHSLAQTFSYFVFGHRLFQTGAESRRHPSPAHVQHLPASQKRGSERCSGQSCQSLCPLPGRRSSLPRPGKRISITTTPGSLTHTQVCGMGKGVDPVTVSSLLSPLCPCGTCQCLDPGPFKESG